MSLHVGGKGYWDTDTLMGIPMLTPTLTGMPGFAVSHFVFTWSAFCDSSIVT
jgi:hypothetical protein